MIDTLLTRQSLAAILCLLSPHAEAGIQTPRIGHKRPLSTVVFLHPSKSDTGLFRKLSIMVGYFVEQPVKRLAGAYAGSLNLTLYSTAQRVRPMGGGLSLYIGTPQ